MKAFDKICLLLTLCCVNNHVQAQTAGDSVVVTVINEKSQPVEGATVSMVAVKKIAAVITNKKGEAKFKNSTTGSFHFVISQSGYITQTTQSFAGPFQKPVSIALQPDLQTLAEVNVKSRRQFIQHSQGKTILNPDAAASNTGTTVLEVLEKSPGVIVDKNGGISLQGKAGVLVMIDDKPTYLSGADLNNLLSSMSSSQVDQIELMTNPPAKYDASGNAGIINIKTKKNKTKGFNGSLTTGAGQGVYPKQNTSLLLNYRNGKFNLFLNYNLNNVRYFTDLYALRKYYNNMGDISAILDQPTFFSGKFLNNTARVGVDYFVTSNTTIGVVVGGINVDRKSTGNAKATWLNATGQVDSAVTTDSKSTSNFKNGSVNINLRQKTGSMQNLAADFDLLKYDITSNQEFDNHLQTSGGYNEASRGYIPSAITILSGKVDYTLNPSTGSTVLAGVKTSHIKTDNTAAYQNFESGAWQEDYGKSNRFLYTENIQAVYTSFETKYKRISLQAGLRYELTGYHAHQLGNVVQKDSAFSRQYGGLFPGGYFTFRADSSNSITLTAGRRIERPAFQTLNPFTFIINKYTYQTGNPFIVPQYSWNIEVSHQYKELLTTAFSYTIVKNYFSQLFLTDTINGLLYYSQGNVGRTHNLGLSSTVSVTLLKNWSFNLQVLYNHKELKGFNGDANFESQINQLNFNLSNQFSFAKVYTAELSGFYTTKARNDLQEELYPTGQLSAGVGKSVLKKKGNVKLSIRDIFFTNTMEGLTQFKKATEYFIIHRDSRVVNLAFTYRFGKAYKAGKHSGSSASDEMERVSNG